MSKVSNTWHSMSKDEAERYWKEDLGQEIAHYDEKKDENDKLVEIEEQIKKLIELNKLTKEEIKWVVGIGELPFEILYNRNKKN